MLILPVKNLDFSLVGAQPGAEVWETHILPCPKAVAALFVP